MRRIISLILGLLLLTGFCVFAEGGTNINEIYKEELRLLNQYMRSPDDPIIADIQTICDTFDANGVIGEYAIEFSIYANVLRLLDEQDYENAKKAASNLVYDSSFENFRNYLTDGLELHNLDLYAIGTAEELLNYVIGRAYEASHNAKMASLSYKLCQRFMDANERMGKLQG